MVVVIRTRRGKDDRGSSQATHLRFACENLPRAPNRRCRTGIESPKAEDGWMDGCDGSCRYELFSALPPPPLLRCIALFAFLGVHGVGDSNAVILDPSQCRTRLCY